MRTQTIIVKVVYCNFRLQNVPICVSNFEAINCWSMSVILVFVDFVMMIGQDFRGKWYWCRTSLCRCRRSICCVVGAQFLELMFVNSNIYPTWGLTGKVKFPRRSVYRPRPEIWRAQQGYFIFRHSQVGTSSFTLIVKNFAIEYFCDFLWKFPSPGFDELDEVFFRTVCYEFVLN